MKPKKVVILGGGTSGWITAAMLTAAHNRPGIKAIDITLIENAGGRIGVGEGTFPTIRSLLQALGVDEKDFLSKTDATFKQGIKFDNWVYAPQEKPHHHFYHPFESARNHGGIPLARAWAERYDRGENIGSFAEACGFQAKLMDHGRAPKRLDHGPYEAAASYAYHLDADKLGDYLAEMSIRRGVTRVVDKVIHVDVDERGWISALETVEHGRIDGEFFVDCSGFQGLLINKALGVPFRNLNDTLLCDRAVALRAPYLPGERIVSYTGAAAQKSGWIWNIGLQSRHSAGYVYSSSFISDDDAEKTLRAVVGPTADGQNARILPMRIGVCQEFWKNNCVAVGLAGGFLEPLEATGIYMIESAARLLAEHFPFGEPSPNLARYFNRAMHETFNEAIDFINLHYWLSKRRDSEFWKTASSGAIMTDTLKERLELWAVRPPLKIDTVGSLTTYQPHSWDCILYGMDWRPRQWSGMHGYADMDDVDTTFEQVKVAQKRALADLPDHMDFLRQFQAG